jgi:hypothetical protein
MKQQTTHLPIPFCFGPLMQVGPEHRGGYGHVTLLQQGLGSVHVAVPLHGVDVPTLH